MKPRFANHPSKKAVRNTLAFYDALANGTEFVAEEARKTGPQAENKTNKIISSWRHLKSGLVLERNKRRLATPTGYHQPIMLGWLAEGSPDWVGYQSVTITPDMLGRRVAIFVGLEAKRAEGGVVSKEQEAFLNALKDAGGVSGVVRNAQDAEDALTRWRERVTR